LGKPFVFLTTIAKNRILKLQIEIAVVVAAFERHIPKLPAAHLTEEVFLWVYLSAFAEDISDFIFWLGFVL
jgi:hypothetical protein